MLSTLKQIDIFNIMKRLLPLIIFFLYNLTVLIFSIKLNTIGIAILIALFIISIVSFIFTSLPHRVGFKYPSFILRLLCKKVITEYGTYYSLKSFDSQNYTLFSYNGFYLGVIVSEDMFDNFIYYSYIMVNKINSNLEKPNYIEDTYFNSNRSLSTIIDEYLLYKNEGYDKWDGYIDREFIDRHKRNSKLKNILND